MPRRSCQRTCPLWWAALVLETAGDRFGLVQPRDGGPPGGLPGERLAHDGVRGGRPGAVVHRVGQAGAGGRLFRAVHEYRDFAHLQVLVHQM